MPPDSLYPPPNGVRAFALLCRPGMAVGVFQVISNMKVTKLLKMIFLLIATANGASRGMNDNCTWSNITFHGGAVKAVNSTATIRVWSEGQNPINSHGLIIWQIVHNESTTDGVVTAEYLKTGAETNIAITTGQWRGNASFTYNERKMSSNLTLILQASDDSSKLEIHDSRCSDHTRYKSLEMVVKYCNATEEISAYDQSDATILINSTDSPAYKDIGDCDCQFGHLFNVTGVPADGRVWCNDTAQWVGCEDVQCWFAPNNITVDQTPVYAENPANLTCNYSVGFPVETNRSFFIGDRNVSEDQTLTWNDNGKQYHCEVANRYTNVHLKQNIISLNRTLEVYFSPKDLSQYSDNINADGNIPIKINKSADVTFTFHANPASGPVNATFRQMNGTGSDLTPSRNDTISDKYTFQYCLKINGSDDHGDYIFNVSTTDPSGFVNITIKIVSGTVGGNEGGNDGDPKIIYISVGCILAVVLIIALVVFLIVYRRRKGKKSASDKDLKEERENPLYGSAPGPSINAEYATVDKSKKKQEKEEKVNPIYQGTSAGGDADTVEEAYAAIDIKKKKKKKEKNSEGSENSAFDPEATYAAVNKPRKKKNVEPPPDVVYSAVQKKKKNDQPADTDLHV